jgi:hypothetical protein
MLLDISNLHDAVAHGTHFPIAIVATIYVACTMVISKLYVVQAMKFLRGENGAGDYCFASKIGQAMLRLAGMVYAIFINDGTVFLVIALDFLGRWIEIASAFVAVRRFERVSATAE